MDKTVIVISRTNIATNRKSNSELPVFFVRSASGETCGLEVRIEGPSRLVYDASCPLDGRTSVWIEVDASVRVDCRQRPSPERELPATLFPDTCGGPRGRRAPVTRIVVNRHVLDKNRRHGTDLPIFSVRAASRARYGYSVNVGGPSTLVFRPTTPLDCGATVWAEVARSVHIECTPPPGGSAAFDVAVTDQHIVASLSMDLDGESPDTASAGPSLGASGRPDPPTPPA